VLILVQQLPSFKENRYGEFRTYIYVVFGVLTAISLFKIFIRRNRAPLINAYAVFIGAISLEFMVLYLLEKNLKFGDLLEIIVPFGLLASSFALPLEKRSLEAITKAYAIAILIISMIQVFYYAGGFLLYEQYIVSDKNIIGSFAATAAGIAFYYALTYIDAGRNLGGIVWISVFALLTSVLVTIRSRAALFSVLVVVIIMTIKSRKIFRKLFVATALIGMISVMFTGLLQVALNSVRQSVVLGYEFTDADSLSGGRFGVYSEAVDIIKEDPLFGEIGAREPSRRIPHNYLLNKVKKYGLMGGSLFISLYVLFVAFILRSLRTMKGISFSDLAIFLLMMPFLISLLEYQHPYGPGTSQAFTYFLLGQYLLAGFPIKAGNLRGAFSADKRPSIKESRRRALIN
jgi:hypothetical protein